ncbi:ribonuclease R (plasmid) [Paroceanicella profunda]|uniref:Ribonuclease R n=1 Tax=Paroceanicella profunda TaxID=2579971 RepID=A0A5B8FJ90_9RHOB|nr:ribonuclease R [Paroceanicella profunda]QDL94177.1 ribonuclease R [Paroceanicella profunda]
MAHFPSKDDILGWIRENPGAVGKREIARAFNVKGAERIALKQLLREMQAEGAIRRERKSFREKGALPPVSVLVVEAPDVDGDLFAHPQDWDGDEAPPRILFIPGKGDPGITQGDRILARLTPAPEHASGHAFEARLIRRIGAGPRRILGLFRKTDQGGRIVPVERKADRDWLVPHGEHAGARDGELVEGEIVGNPRLGLPRAKVIARLGDPAAPRSVSLIAIHEHGLPVEFSEEAIAEALAAKPVPLGDREDLRALPLLTIDPSDARDHDDAVCAHADDDPANPGGHVLWVAIADVAHYVRPGSALDREARKRGNSSYFPDRVVPMLPEELSGDLCSLHEGVDRPCIALRMVLSADGTKRSHRFTRGLMRSPASLSYEQAQAAHDGAPDAATAPLLETAIAPLFAAYGALKAARERRQPLALDLPERKIILSEEGEVLSVAFRERFDAHKLIEEFMVLSNVCAAETLERRARPLLYRAHEEPTTEKLDALREIAESCGLTLARGQVLQTAQFNRLLDQAAGSDFSEMINLSVLRSQTQAYYTREAIGHFGLALARYAHFTSPIRRYADLVVHRALISAHGWGNDGLTAEETDALEETAKHISMTERRSMEAERDTTDRYLAAFLADRVGNEFEGKVSGVTRFGLFIRLTDTGADGLVPISSLGREYFHYDADSQTLTGERTRREIGLGMRATVRLAEAVPVTGGLLFELLEIEGKPAPRGAPVKGRGPVPRRKAVKARSKSSKLEKKAKRRF